jgi:hypothetical protein
MECPALEKVDDSLEAKTLCERKRSMDQILNVQLVS